MMRGFQRLYNIKSGNDLKLMVYLLLRRTGIRFCNSYSEALIVNLLISSSSAGEKITGARKKSAGTREKSAGDGKKSAGTREKSAGDGKKSAGAQEKSAGDGKKSAGAREKSAGDGKKMTGAGISFRSEERRVGKEC